MYSFSLEPKHVPLIETKHRRIATLIPHPESVLTIQKSIEKETLSMNDQLPIVWDSAKDYQVFDKHGNAWIDFTSTIFVANIGHSHPDVCKAMINTISKPLLNSYNYTTDLRVKFAEALLAVVPSFLNKVLFLSTGSESSEASIKMARIWGKKQTPIKKYIIAFENSFHGKTMGSQTLGGKESGKKWIESTHPEILHLPYPYPWVLQKEGVCEEQFFETSINNLFNKQKITPEEIAAIMLEPYQGWCAVFFPQKYIQALSRFCKKYCILIGVDEVQSGFGRTGKMWGYECYENFEPDMIWCGKAISASIPVSCVVAKSFLLEGEPSFNSTHGGNPIGMSASLASLRVLQNQNLVSESLRKGNIIQSILEQWKLEFPNIILNFYGSGMVWAVLIKKKNSPNMELDIVLVDKIIEKAFQRGVLSIRTCSGTIKLGPPLTTPDEALIEGLQVLKECIFEAASI
jgi:4-aminobutyrate aminotransferase / (S)-3-amino-2-methylpropionate transaminase / 5-aminovalerate transaminase